MVDGAPIFKAVAYGSGDLEGLKMTASHEGTPFGTIAIKRRISDPHGFKATASTAGVLWATPTVGVAHARCYSVGKALSGVRSS